MLAFFINYFFQKYFVVTKVSVNYQEIFFLLFHFPCRHKDRDPERKIKNSNMKVRVKDTQVDIL